MSEKFIDREYLLDSFKDYNTDIVEKKFDQVNSNLEQLEYGEVAGGKNILDITQNYKRYSDGVLSVSGNKVTVTGQWHCYFIIDVEENTDYFISGNVDSYTVNYEIAIYNEELNESVARYCLNGTFNSGNHTKLAVILYSGTQESGTTVFSNIQIEKGTQATEYEPYIPSVNMLAEEVSAQNDSLSDLEYLGWSAPDKCSLKNYKDTNEAFHQKVGRVFVDGNTSLSSYNITVNGAVAISYSALGISLEEKKNILCCATLEPIIESEMINGKIGYHASPIDDFIYVNIKGSASSIDEFKASVNASPLVFYYKLDSEKIIIDGNEAISSLKNDLGGLSFSVSGTTLSITDGTNTWTLEAN